MRDERHETLMRDQKQKIRDKRYERRDERHEKLMRDQEQKR